MAVRGAVRFKPDTNKTALEATIGGLNAAATPPTGTVYMVAQLVAYDDTVVTPANYTAGDPATERNITVLYEETLSKDLAVFNGINQAAATALWATALTAWRDQIAPAAPNMLKAIRGARRAAPVLLG
jgi:hypothetical protein